MNNEDKMTP